MGTNSQTHKRTRGEEGRKVENTPSINSCVRPWLSWWTVVALCTVALVFDRSVTGSPDDVFPVVKV